LHSHQLQGAAETCRAALQGLPQSLSFLSNLLRNVKPPGDLKDLSPEELRVEAARRETVELRAEVDLDKLREHAVQLVYARELLKAKNNELKQMLTDSQARSLRSQALKQTRSTVAHRSALALLALARCHWRFRMQTQIHSDESITQELVQAKLDLADAAYQRLHLESALHVAQNKNRKLSAKLTQAAVERDLLSHRLSRSQKKR
jgi:hypothetical protein